MLFASSLFGFSFTTEQFAQIYADTYGGFPAPELAKRLWGDIWFDEATRKFKRSAPAGGGTRSFVHFVIEPLYKMFSQAVGEEPKDLVKVSRPGSCIISPEPWTSKRPGPALSKSYSRQAWF